MKKIYLGFLISITSCLVAADISQVDAANVLVGLSTKTALKKQPPRKGARSVRDPRMAINSLLNKQEIDLAKKKRAEFEEFKKAHPIDKVAEELGMDPQVIAAAYTYCNYHPGSRMPEDKDIIEKFAANMKRVREQNKLNQAKHRAEFEEFKEARPIDKVVEELGMDPQVVADAYTYCRSCPRNKMPEDRDTIEKFAANMKRVREQNKLNQAKHRAEFEEFEEAHPIDKVVEELGMDPQVVADAYTYCNYHPRSKMPKDRDTIEKFAASIEKRRERNRSAQSKSRAKRKQAILEESE